MDTRDQYLAECQTNSYKNFHCKGLDYICMFRTPNFTDKFYFFNGDVSKLPEVVFPHNHRYAFQTRVLCGSLLDIRYEESEHGDVFQRYDWMTPLNGGNGFTHVAEEKLRPCDSNLIGPNDWGLDTKHDEIHTIKVMEHQTILRIIQWKDVVPMNKPTQTWARNKVPPSLSGLYEKFTTDEIINKFAILEEFLPIIGHYTGEWSKLRDKIQNR